MPSNVITNACYPEKLIELLDGESTPSTWKLITFENEGITVYNKPEGLTRLAIIQTAPGGGSGGVEGLASGQACSGGGAAGGTTIKLINDPDDVYTINNGAPGSGGASGNNWGSDGGSSSVSSDNTNILTYGGGAGQGMTATTGYSTAYGDYSGYGNNGFSISGGDPSDSVVDNGVVTSFSNGASSFWGGNAPLFAFVNADEAYQWGAGAASVSTRDSTNRAGMDGGLGVTVFVEIY